MLCDAINGYDDDFYLKNNFIPQYYWITFHSSHNKNNNIKQSSDTFNPWKMYELTLDLTEKLCSQSIS